MSRLTLAHRTLALCTLLLCAVSLRAWSYIDYTKSQRESVIEMLEQLEERHYSKQSYDDNLSSQHLDSYIESLDRSKLFLD